MSVEDAIMIAAVAVLSFGLTRALIPVLTRKALIDHPNERSSHVAPTPRGGGWAIVLPVLAIMIFKLMTDGWPNVSWTIIFGAVALAGVSWVDDMRSLSVRVRLLVQLAAVTAVIGMIPSAIVEQLPIVLTVLFMVGFILGWVWFINLYNFMDGIDGITGAQTIFVCGGIAAVHWASGSFATGDVALPLAVASATAGFLYWNWSPAKVFMGDIGSVFLGFIVGWLLIDLLIAGHWAAAIILPLYYLADASLTLARRVLRGDKFWQAHREHFYQRAHQAGLSHRNVVYRISLGNLFLVGIAIWSINGEPVTALISAIGVTGILLYELARRPVAS